MMRRARVVAVATFVMAGAALPMAGSAVADRGDGRVYTISNPPLAPLVVDGEATTVPQGELRGSGYIIEVPPEWNGELVMWAHGYRGDGTVLTVNAPGYGLRDHLMELGYAWAASSYDLNGYVVDAGVRSTRELAIEFRRAVGRPDRTYIAGVSMGGHIIARSIEQHPSFYDGAMPLCGVVGDVELFDFFVDFTFVGQALAGEDVYPISDDYQRVVVPRMQVELGTAGIGLGPPTNELGLQFRSIVVEQTGGPRPGANVAFSVWKEFLFSLARPDNGGPLSLNPGRVGTNVDTDYEPDEPVAIDDEVRRVEPQDARARRSQRLGPIATIDGRIRVPVLSLHDLGDLFVPFSMEQYYAEDVAKQGRSELLVQRAIRAVGHCEFSEAEITTAFDDLVAWVEDGVHPEGDVVTDPAAVAAADFGCRFSQPEPANLGSRVLFAPCPDWSGRVR
jgi:pimeloyl-ACP methyl ester carboxylesterase